MPDQDMEPSAFSGLLFHGKINGDLDGGEFHDRRTYFTSNPNVASIYAKHCALNNEACAGDDDFLSAEITIFPVILTLDNPALVNRDLLFAIGKERLVADQSLGRFADDFEDSLLYAREEVFSWLVENGYDGAILENDLMPVAAGGDWDFVTTYVSFYPLRQVAFKISQANTDSVAGIESVSVVTQQCTGLVDDEPDVSSFFP